MPSNRLARERSKLARLLIQYRERGKLTQQQLSDLTYQLADEYPDTIRHGIPRVMIVRAEGRTIPMPETLLILSHALAYAMRAEGFDTVSGDDLYNHLAKTTRTKIATRDVSPEAAELDAILAPLNKAERRVIYTGLIANARAQVGEQMRFRRAFEEVRRRKAADSTPYVPPSDDV